MKKCIICDYDINHSVDCDSCYAYIIGEEVVGYNISGKNF